ncbi:MAG: hypothetical protein KGJ43_02220 [Acidobacteriota bacterium]|nr:hypothetical protein [Acidobacteriota bacterium]
MSSHSITYLAGRAGGAALAAAVLLLGVPALAPATLDEVGVLPKTTPPTVPSCPGNPCLAVSRTTGFQTQVGTAKSPLAIPREGTIVAWTVTLSKPTATQIKFFNEREGGAASAQIAILQPKPAPRSKRGSRKPPPETGYTLVAQSPLVALEKYFGQTAQFPLETTIKVKKGDIVALTVPTWAPALALGFAKTTSWRASRPKSACSETSTQTAHIRVGVTRLYPCVYHEARLAYSATLISTP